MRGDEISRLTLVALSVHRNCVTAPLSLEAGSIDVQWAKGNYGDKIDVRLVPHNKTMHQCPLPHFGLHFWAKLNPPGGAQPFRWADITTGAWYVY